MGNYKLKLIQIKCHDKTEWGNDEPYINVDGSRRWGSSMDDGDTKSINLEFEYANSISISLREDDGGLHGKDDHIGSTSFGKTPTGTTTVVFSGAGAKYTIWYSIAAPPPPKLQFNPQLAFSLTEIRFIKDYYRPIPKHADITFDFNCFGVVNRYSLNQLEFPPDGKFKPQQPQPLATKTVSFQELVNPLNGIANGSFIGISAKILEYYQWYLPKTNTTFSITPIITARPQDKGIGFQKWVKVNGDMHNQEANFKILLGYQYELFFNVVMSFDRTLVHNELTRVDQFRDSVRYYLSKITEFASDVEANVSIDLEIENVEAQPRLIEGKPMKVVKEAKKGRNLHFQDTDGFTMNREEFVSAIKQGLYPGYHVRKIKGVETPVSDPDNTTKNNLG